MNIQLKKRYQDWIAEQVKTGRYASEIEAVEEALAEKIENDEQAAYVEHIRERLRQAEDDVRNGRTVVADDAFFERLRARVREIAEKSRE